MNSRRDPINPNISTESLDGRPGITLHRQEHRLNRRLLWLVLFLILPLAVTAQTQNDSSQLLNFVGESEGIPVQVHLYKSDPLLTRAYQDVFEIVAKPNSCSEFYGGPNTATVVLNKFVARITTSQLPAEIVFIMKGSILSGTYQASIRPYRLFEQTIVNTRGSFYRKAAFEPNMNMPSVGSFPAGTRRARALTLLHELGHLIEGPNHDWLLRDDGMNWDLSQHNTRLVQKACRHELDLIK